MLRLTDDVDFKCLLRCADLTQIIATDNKIEKIETLLQLTPLAKLF